MNFSNIERLPRISKEETKELVKRHPGLRNLFPKKGVVWHCSQGVYMDGFLNSSRFSNPELSLRQNLDKSSKAKLISDENDDEFSDAGQSITSTDQSLAGLRTSHKDQKRKFAISLATLSAKPYKRSAIVKDGGIKTLLELSSVSDSVIRKSCSIAFSLLAKEQSLRPKMIDDGVIAALISLSSTHNYYIKINCCQALCNIFCEPGSEPRGVREGATQALIRIASICPDSVEPSLYALLNLSCVSEKFQRIEELNEALFYFNDTSALTDEHRLIILATLCNLSAIRNNQLRLVEDGCLRIVEWAWASPNEQMRIRGSEIIRNLTTEYRSRGKLVENNLIWMLLTMANDSLEEVRVCAIKALYILSKDASCRQKIVSGSGMDVLLMLSTGTYKNIDIGRTTAKVWRVLCRDPNTASSAIKFGIVKAFMAQLASSSDDQCIQQCVVESICLLLSYDDQLVEMLVADGVLTVIVLLIRSYKEAVTSEWLAYSLYLITSTQLTIPTTRDAKIIELGVLPSLIKLACSHVSTDTTRCLCSGSFVNLTLMKDVDSAKAISVLVYLLRNETSMITRMNCSTSLYNLSYNDDNCYQMLDAGVLMPIVEFVVKSDRDEAILGNKEREKLNNSNDDASRSRSNSYALPAIQPQGMSRTQSISTYLLNNLSSAAPSNTSTIKDLIRTKIKCAAILSRLTLFEKYYHLFINNNLDVQLLHVLLKLSIVDDLPTQRRVVSALANLTKNPFLRVKLLSLNPIAYILSLASKRDEKLWYGCCCIICNLSYEYGSERMMVEGGIVPTLLITALINTDSIASKIICAKALANLLTVSQGKDEEEHDKSHEEEEYSLDGFDEDALKFIEASMVTDGVIWGISSLAQLHNSELLTICAKILYRLSVSHAKDIMESAAAVKALIKIINTHDLQLLGLGGEIVMNILIDSRQRDLIASKNRSKESDSSKGKGHSFRKTIVENMKALASSNDADVMKICVSCLYLISESDSDCCKSIVTSGLLKQINHGSYNKTLIFSTKTFSLAYLTLINNIARAYSTPDTNDLPTGTVDDLSDKQAKQWDFDVLKSLLDDEFLSRVNQIVDQADEELDITALKAIYIFSCYQETVETLAKDDHNIVSLIDRVWHRTDYEKSIDLIELMVAILFNMSVHLSVQATIVSQGIVKTLVSLWEYVHESARLDKEMIASITQYALTTANSANTGGNGQGGNSSANNNRVNKIQPAAAIKVNKPVAGLSFGAMSPKSILTRKGSTLGVNVKDSNASKPVTRLSFSPTSSSFYSISSNGASFASFSTVATLPVNTSAYQQGNHLAQSDAVVLISNHQIFMKLMILICSAVSHLGCGNINTAKMIEDGCAPILTFITQSYKSPGYLNYIFDYGVYYRCSAAFRNLLLNISYQASLIESGCLPGLIDLFALITRAEQQSIAVETTSVAKEAFSAAGIVLSSAGTGAPTSSSPHQQRHHRHHHHHHANTAAINSVTSHTERELRQLICKNCASALRSLTYNINERESLISSGAIYVILSDLKNELADDEMSSLIDSNLLHEIEAESWQNGIRRQQREEKARDIVPSHPYTEYLLSSNQGYSKILSASYQAVIDIPIDPKYDLIEKFNITAMESAENHSASMAAAGVGKNGEQLLPFQQLDDTISVINIRLEDLTSYEDTDDTSHAITQQYSKTECIVSEDQLLNQLRSPKDYESKPATANPGTAGSKSRPTSRQVEKLSEPVLGDMLDLNDASVMSLYSSESKGGSRMESRNKDGSVIEDGEGLNDLLNESKALKLNDLPNIDGAFGSRQGKEDAIAEGLGSNASLSKSEKTKSPKKQLKSFKSRGSLSSGSIGDSGSPTRKGLSRHLKKDKFTEIVAKINSNSRDSAQREISDSSAINDVLQDWKSLKGRR